MSVKIYALRNRSSDKVFIGSTKVRYLSQRLATHRFDTRQEASEIALCPTAFLEILEVCEDDVRDERQKWWIEQTPACINKRYKPPTDEHRERLRLAGVERQRRYRERWRNFTGKTELATCNPSV